MHPPATVPPTNQPHSGAEGEAPAASPMEGATPAPVIVTAQQSYTVLKTIGEGGMGQVFLVQDPARSDPVALKFLPAGLMSEQRIGAFKREFSMLAELHHPHVCRVYDFGYSSAHRQYFFTCELVEGTDLFRAMLQAPIDEIEQVIAQILSALDFIHTVGLIHFDIKGDNILVSRKRGGVHATLVDFGVTSPAGQPLKEIAGTLLYMAPELFQPDPQVDHRADLYSFGVACYRLLAGVYPYEIGTLQEAQAWHRNPRLDREPLRQKGVPEYLCQLIEQLMAPDPANRYSSARVALDYLCLHSGAQLKVQPSLARATLVEGPLTGRDSLVDTARHAIRRVVQQHGAEHSIDQEEHTNAYLVGGARGAGKSRLLKEIKYTAQLEDCAPFSLDGEREGRDLQLFLAALGGEVPTVGTPDHASQYLCDHAMARPTCYLIDNLDRACPAVVKAVTGLLARLYSAALAHTAPPLVVMITYTTGSTLTYAAGATRLELEPLTHEEVASFIAELLGPIDDQPACVEAVWNFSRGNALLMTEATRRYHDKAGALPQSIEAMYAQQIATLAPPARALLECAAFAHEPLDPDALTALGAADAAGSRQELVTLGLLREHPDTRAVTPATGALAQSVVAGLSAERRRTLADRMVAWLGKRPGVRALEMAEFALHLSDHAQAITLLQAAAREAEQQGESDLAMLLLGQAIAMLQDTNGPADVITAHERKIATLLLYQGKYHECEERLHRIAKQHATPDVEDLKLLGLAKRAQRKPDEAGVYYDQALQILTEDHANPVYLFLLNERAQAHLEAGHTDQAVQLYRQSHAWTQQLPAAQQQRVTNNNLGMALARQGKPDEALAFYQQKLATFRHDKRITASASGQLGIILLQAGKNDEALAAFITAWQKSVEAGDTHNAPALLDNIIALLQRKAKYSEALEYAQTAFKMKAASASDADLTRSLIVVANLYLQLALPDLAARYLTQAMRLARKCRAHELAGMIHISFGYLYKDLGRVMESINAFEEVIAIGEDHHDDNLIRRGCYGAVDLLVENGEIEEAMPYMQRLQPLIGEVTDPEFRLRCEMLARKTATIKQAHPPEELRHELESLIAQCGTHEWAELGWELEYVLGIFHQKRDEPDAALAHLTTAHDMIMRLADGLSEEYRESFRRQRSRARVLADWAVLYREHGVPSDPDNEDGTATNVHDAGTMVSRAAPSDGKTMAAPTRTPTITVEPAKSWTDYEREILTLAMQQADHDLPRAAAALGVDESWLREKLIACGLLPHEHENE